MRRRSRIIAIATATAIATAVTLATASCATAGNHTDQGLAEPQLQGQWQLTSATDAGGKIDLLRQAITLTIASATHSTGRSSCSNYTAKFLGTAESLWVTATLPQHIDCGSVPQQVLEQRYITALGYVKTATVDGGDLDLLAPGIDLHYVRALLIPMTFVTGRTWRLTTLASVGFEVGEVSEPFAEQGATLRFNTNGTLKATTGCSTVTAHYIQNAGQIVADHVVVHEVTHCNDYNQTVDDVIVRIVNASFSFSAAKGQLDLTCPRAGIQLSFVNGPAID